ncbi:MAG: homoserine dehydrogenase [Spirochaetota bacterium]|jgi:homoserine dehydrogenase|nr:homoserine dehydrogenase [Spirochaetota bacterium]
MEVRIGIAGFGTIGTGVYELLTQQAGLIRERLGMSIIISAIAEPRLDAVNNVFPENARIVTDGMELVHDDAIDIIVELVGGRDFPLRLISAALENGKHVVTANKALLAYSGQAIYDLAARKGRALGIEASVAGGIPIIKTIREALIGNRIREVRGIINGTCNYILTRMAAAGSMSFGDALAEAKAHGFAEADPGLDISGRDAAHKIAILASLAFNTPVAMEDVYIEGIDGIESIDIQYARVLGYVIKLLGIARDNGAEGIEARVHPTLILEDNQLASIRNEYNAVYLDCDFLGNILLSGKGAGAHPTASAVVGDITDIALMMRDHKTIPPYFSSAGKRNCIPFGKTRNRYYMRFTTLDRPGILSKITGILGENNISIARMIQKEENPDHPVPIVMISHSAVEEDMARAMQAINDLPEIHKPAVLIRAL